MVVNGRFSLYWNCQSQLKTILIVTQAQFSLIVHMLWDTHKSQSLPTTIELHPSHNPKPYGTELHNYYLIVQK